MSWILEHLQIVIAIVAAIAYMINNTRKPKVEPKSQRGAAQSADPEEAARTRRIQEEIQRKILERRSGMARSEPLPSSASERTSPPPLVATRPVANSMGGLREKLDARLAQQRAREATQRAAEENERRIEMKEQQEEVDRRDARRQAEMQVAIKARARIKSERATANPATQDWLKELRNPASVRRAVVMREVLGTPVGLR